MEEKPELRIALGISDDPSKSCKDYATGSKMLKIFSSGPEEEDKYIKKPKGKEEGKWRQLLHDNITDKARKHKAIRKNRDALEEALEEAETKTLHYYLKWWNTDQALSRSNQALSQANEALNQANQRAIQLAEDHQQELLLRREVLNLQERESKRQHQQHQLQRHTSRRQLKIGRAHV